jgi:hypothetical protein
MPPVKKIRPITFRRIEEDEAIWALQIQGMTEIDPEVLPSLNSNVDKLKKGIDEGCTLFKRMYHHDYRDTVIEMYRWCDYIFSENRSYSWDEIYKGYIDCLERVNKEPCKIYKIQEQELSSSHEWIFKGYVYEVNGFYTDDEIKLLLLEDFTQERRYFEKLNTKFNETTTENAFERSRIPENVRFEVWRRDGGKCARCGNREKLEYDHIVPISKGGSNTARNIELLCEKCNRSKSNNVV